MRVKYKEGNSSLCQNYSDVLLAMSLPTSSGFIELKKTPNSKIVKHQKNKKINVVLKHAQKY